MSKIKIYELAKELDKPSKELVEFLNKKDVEAKTHMSTIDEAEADMVKMENELKQKRRLKNYKRLKTKMFDFLNQLCTGTVYVRNLSDIYYDEDDRVCSFFDVNKEFECFEDDFNMIHANKKQIEFTGEYGTINITLEDLCRAFELGFNTIDEIYLMKSEFGSIDIRNILGLNYSQNV